MPFNSWNKETNWKINLNFVLNIKEQSVFLQRRFFASSSNFRIPISLQCEVVNSRHFKLRLLYGYNCLPLKQTLRISIKTNYVLESCFTWTWCSWLIISTTSAMKTTTATVHIQIIIQRSAALSPSVQHPVFNPDWKGL